jgi:hypothetical protein
MLLPCLLRLRRLVRLQGGHCCSCWGICELLEKPAAAASRVGCVLTKEGRREDECGKSVRLNQ